MVAISALSSPQIIYAVIAECIVSYNYLQLFVGNINFIKSLSRLFFLQIKSYLASFGYNIVIAVPLVKTWRVYYIYKNPYPNKKVA